MFRRLFLDTSPDPEAVKVAIEAKAELTRSQEMLRKMCEQHDKERK